MCKWRGLAWNGETVAPNLPHSNDLLVLGIERLAIYADTAMAGGFSWTKSTLSSAASAGQRLLWLRTEIEQVLALTPDPARLAL